MKRFNIDQISTEHYVLRLYLGTDCFIFAAYSTTESPSFLHFQYPTERKRSLAANIKCICKENPFSGKKFKNIHILLADTPCIAVPQELFNEAQAETLYYACMPKKSNCMIQHHILSSHQLVLLYETDKTVQQLLLDEFPDACIQSSFIPPIKYLHERCQLSDRKKIYVHLQHKNMNLYAFDDKHFLMQNTFRCTNGNDLVYFLLYTWQQLGFNQEKDELYITGNLPDKEIVLKELHRFIQQIAIINPMAEFKRAEFAKADIGFDLQTSFYFENKK